MVLSCFPVMPWLALMQIRCTHGTGHAHRDLPCQERAWLLAWMLRPYTKTMDRGTAGPPSNGWPMRWKSADWRACFMQAMGPRCDWTCATYPWMAIIWTLPQCSSSMVACFTLTTVASSRTPGPGIRMKTTWGPPEATHSWPSESVSGSPSSWPQGSSGRHWMGGYCQRQHPRVSNAQFPSASPWGWYAGASAGNTQGPRLWPGPGRYPYTQWGEVPRPTAYLQVCRVVQGGCCPPAPHLQPSSSLPQVGARQRGLQYRPSRADARIPLPHHLASDLVLPSSIGHRSWGQQQQSVIQMLQLSPEGPKWWWPRSIVFRRLLSQEKHPVTTEIIQYKIHRRL